MRIAGCIAMMAIMLIFPKETGAAAREALGVWATDVVPGIFAFMVLVRIVAGRMVCGSKSGFIAAACLGLLGGSPAGASATSVLHAKGALTLRGVLSLYACTGCISPIFILSTLSRWLSDAALSRMLLASLTAGSALSALIVTLFFCKTKPATDSSSHATQLPAQDDPVRQSIQAVLGVGGYIVFFSVLSCGLSRVFFYLPSAAHAFFHAILEVSGGLHALSQLSFSRTVLGTLSAALLGFCGLSVLNQNAMLLKPCGVYTKQLLCIACLRSILCALIMAILLRIIPS